MSRNPVVGPREVDAGKGYRYVCNCSKKTTHKADSVLFDGHVLGDEESVPILNLEQFKKRFVPAKQVIFTSPRDWLYSAWNYVCVSIQNLQLAPVRLDIDSARGVSAIGECSGADAPTRSRPEIRDRSPRCHRGL